MHFILDHHRINILMKDNNEKFGEYFSAPVSYSEEKKIGEDG